MTKLVLALAVALLTGCPPTGENWDRSTDLRWEAKILKQQIEVERLKSELAEELVLERDHCECGAR